jgi:hypothetical protein
VADIRIDQKDKSDSERRTDGPLDATPNLAGVRDEDLEPHAGLRYVARLFKVMALLLLFLLVGEVVLNLYRQGSNAIPGLLVEATRLIVFGGLLWGAADLALMLIESNHDLRATRILVGRLNGKVQRLESMSFGQGAQSPPPAGGVPPRVEVPREPR